MEMLGQVYSMFSRFLSLLALTKEELTPARVEPFRVDLVNEEPIFDKPIRYNRVLTEHIKGEVASLLSKGLIDEVESSWASKVVMAPKGKGWRMCVDYRGVNLKTRPDRYPLPNIEDIYTWLVDKRYFSKIDLLSGYW